MNKIYLKRFISRALLGLVVVAVLSACATSPSTGEPSFEVQLTKRNLQIVQGSSLDFQVQLNRNGFTDPITVTASELPAGVTAGAVTTTGSTATLRFLAADDAAQGDSKRVSIFATAGGKTSETVTTSLSVRGTPGALDTTFSGGRVTIPSFTNRARAALTPDGGIVHVASDSSGKNISLTRLTSDGKPDPNFPTRILDLAPGQSEFVGGVAVQPDGKIVVGVQLGSTQPGISSLGVARFTPQGELDPSFSGDGITTLDSSQTFSGLAVNALALGPDGKIVVVGSASIDARRFVLAARFTPDGQPSMGSSGFRFDSPETDRNSDAKEVIVAPDGSFIVAGVTQVGTSTSRGFVSRYLVDGTKDTAFGQAGHVIIDFSDNINDDIISATVTALALQPDGKIMVAGRARHASDVFDSMAVARLLPDGSRDKSFSGDGSLLLEGQTSADILLEPNGRIVVAGTTSDRDEEDFVVTRFEPDGKFDLSFGNEGRRITDFGITNDLVSTLLRASNGRLILVGSSDFINLALARYWP